MSSHVAWFAVSLVGLVCVGGATALATLAIPTVQQAVTWKLSLSIFGAAAVALAVLGFAWRVHAVAHADGRVVRALIHDRNPTLNGIFSVVTTVGDVVPTFTIAGVLALLFYRRTGSLAGLALPVVMLAQLVIQTAFLDGVKDLTLEQVIPGITLGGSNGLPSGAISRLLPLFLLAAILWRSHDPKAARRLVDTGSAVVFIELISRLYLGRHLLADIVGGLLLGLMLTIAVGWLLYLAEGARGAQGSEPARARA